MKMLAAALGFSFCASFCASFCGSAQAQTVPVGRLHHYVRSNQDGSLPEQIYVYLASETRVEVGKMVERCTNAAFVTGEMDRALNQPRALVGGRLGRDGEQQPFAWLTYDAGRMHARVPPAGIDQDLAIDGEPWMLYDFDLSDMNALRAGRAPPRQDFSVAVALIWPEPNSDNMFRNLGFAHARFAAAETHLDRPALRFEVTGGLNGQIWFDASQGHVLEASFAEPNHTEYASFRLVLQSVEDDAADEWAAVRRAHWEGCPS